MASTLVTIGADLSELQRELAKIPNLTGDAAQKALTSLERVVQKASAEAKKAISSQAAAAKTAAKASEALTRTQNEGAKALFELSGGSGDALEKVTKLGAALTNPWILATTAIAATTAGVAAFAGATAGAVLAAAKFGEELKVFKDIESVQVVDKQGLREIQEAAAGIKALGVVAKAAVVALGSELAPVVKEAAVVVTTLGLAALDTFRTFWDGGDAIRTLATWLGEGLVEAAIRPVDALVELMRTIGRVADLAGQDQLAGQIHKMVKTYDGFVDIVSGAGVDLIFEGVGDAAASLKDRFADNAAEAEALFKKLSELEYGAKGAAKEVQNLGEALKASQEASADQVESYFGLLDALGEVETASKQASLEAVQSAIERALAERDADLMSIESMREEALALAETITAKETVEEQYRASREALEAEHSLRLGKIYEETAAKAQEEAEKAALAQQDQIEQNLVVALSIVGSIEDVLSTVQDRVHEVYDLHDSRAETSASKIEALRDKLADGAGTLSDAEIAAIEAKIAAEEEQRSMQREAAKEARTQAMAAYKAGKALGIASTVASGISASVAALAPPPIGLGPLAGVPLAAATAASTAAGVAQIAATPPPAFDTGGLIGARTPDQVIIRALPGERVLPREQSKVDKKPGPTVVVNTYRQRVFDAVVQDALSIPNSALSRAVRSSTRVGHRK